MRNKHATMGTVADEAARLIKEQEGELPSARELSKATGFSVGTIYSHFGSFRGIIRYIVYRRQCAHQLVGLGKRFFSLHVVSSFFSFLTHDSGS